MATADTSTQVCYRHPGRQTGVRCSNCGRPICPDCMTPTPVGMRCPECSRQRTQVRSLASTRAEPRVTVAIIIACAVAFLASGSIGPGGGGHSAIYRDGALYGPAVADGELWRLVTSGFLHSGFIHIGFNMYLLWILGQMLEPELGSVRFAALYFTSLLCGSFGALLLDPNALTVGASGAVFGLMGAAAVELRSRGVNPLQTDIGMLIVFNLALSFVIPNISVGGHVGGLIGGALAALILDAARRAGARSLVAGLVGCLALSGAAVAGALAVV
jgi:membrane associated rhomboid family serine protease